MNYAEARPLIQTGDLIALRQSHGGFPALTRLVTRSPYTHTSVAIWCADRLLVAETQGAGSCLRPLSNYDADDFDVIACPLDRREVEGAIWQLLGRKISYDVLDLITIGLHRLVGVPLPPADDDKLICSTLSAVIWQAAGWRPTGLPSIAAPDDVVRAGGAVVLKVRNG